MEQMSEADYRRMGIEADAVVRLGMLLMGAGTSGYRVMRAMKRAARALGFDKLDLVVGIVQITSTFHRGNTFRTVISRQHNPAVDASRIEALEDLAHNRLYPGITAEELEAMLDDVEYRVRARWNRWYLALAAAVACAAFAVLNFFPPTAVAVVAVAAAAGQLTRGELHRRHVHQTGCVIAAAAVASLTFLGIATLLNWDGWADPHDFTFGYVAAVLFLVPGFPLFSSLIDLARFDFEAGLPRLAYAFTVISTATFTVAMISWATELNPIPGTPRVTAAWSVAAAIASFLGVAGFAFIFNSSRRMVLVAATVGMVANCLRLVVLHAGATEYFAALVGGFVVGLLGAAAAKWALLPRITTTVPAAVIMVPGATMYRAVYDLNAGAMDQALANTATGMLIVLSIGAGLIFARLLTDPNWTFGHLIDFSPEAEDWQAQRGYD